MDNDQISKRLYFDLDQGKRTYADQLVGVWLTDLNGGFSLKVKKDSSVQVIHQYLTKVNQSIELNSATWKGITSGEVKIYDAIITGKVNLTGNHWDIIHFFDHLKGLEHI